METIIAEIKDGKCSITLYGKKFIFKDSEFKDNELTFKAFGKEYLVKTYQEKKTKKAKKAGNFNLKVDGLEFEKIDAD